MSKKNMRAILVLYTMFVLSLSAFANTPTLALGSPVFTIINPQTNNSQFRFYTNTTSVGFRFNATVWVSEGIDVVLFQIYMTFDVGKINATRVWVPTWNTAYIFYGMEDTVGGAVDIRIGSVLIADSKLPITPTSGVDFAEPRILAIIEFEVQSKPTELHALFSELRIDYSDTILWNADLTNISIVKMNTYYELVWLEPRLQVKPSEYVAVKESETFNVVIWLNDTTSSDRLVSAEFILSYNATLLDVLSVTEGSLLSKFGTTTFIFSDDQAGSVTIKNYLNPPYPLQGEDFPEGNGTIATVMFQSIHQDFYKALSCPLELASIQLVNDGGSPTAISPSINGFYMIVRNDGSYITVNVAPVSVVVGSNVTLSGNIKPNKENARVTIYSRSNGQPWINLTTVTTGISSNYEYNLTASSVGTFEFKANWTGDAVHDASESEIVTLTVMPFTSTLTINVNPTVITIGENSTISGTLDVTRAGITVTIHYRLTGQPWNILTNQTEGNGKYSYVWTPDEGGSYELYASWEGDSITLGAQSPQASLTVKKRPSVVTMAMNVTSTSIYVGTLINVSGTVSDHALGTPITDASVQIYSYQINTTELGTRMLLNTVTTDADGNYHYLWTATKRTLANNETLRFYASWSGDRTTAGSNSVEDLWLTIFRTNSTVTLSLNLETVIASTNVKVDGTITPKKPQAAVAIYYRLVGGDWQNLASVETDMNGAYTYTWTSTKKTLDSSEAFEFKASWLGDAVSRQAESNAASVTVQRSPSLITLNIDRSIITIGYNVSISGAVTPVKANINVTIHCRDKGTGSQSTLLTQTNYQGYFEYLWKPMKNTTFELYASWDGNFDAYSNQSRSLTLEVNLIRHGISISISPEILTAGSSATISGATDPSRANTTVTIYYRPAGTNQPWALLGSASIGKNGEYNYIWAPSDPGTYEIEVGLPGDDFHGLSRSETKTIIVEQGSSPIPSLYIVGIVAAIAVTATILIGYMIKIRKRKA